MDEDDDLFTGQSHSLPVMVEYEFFNVPSSCLGQLPERVTRAVNALVQRQRVPSDEDVREMVRDEESQTSTGDTSAVSADVVPSPAEVAEAAELVEPARVRVMMPHNVAMELALHRSFQEGGNVEQRRALTTAEVLALVQRSRRVNLRRLRAERDDDDMRPRRRRLGSPPL